MKTFVSNNLRYLGVVVKYKNKYYRGLLDKDTDKLEWVIGQPLTSDLNWYVNKQDLDKEQVPEEVVNKVKNEISKALI